jgi:hypothetical protein
MYGEIFSVYCITDCVLVEDFNIFLIEHVRTLQKDSLSSSDHGVETYIIFNLDFMTVYSIRFNKVLV